MTCPVCRANHVYSSHRHSILERGPLTWLGVLPFRCGQCQTRFYKIALRDPRRHRKGGDVASPVDVPRAARWTTEMTAEVTVHAPGQPTTVLKGLAENASLEGVRLRLPTGLPDGSLGGHERSSPAPILASHVRPGSSLRGRTGQCSLACVSNRQDSACTRRLDRELAETLG